MAWTDLKAAIADIITTNGNQEITGALLQQVLNSIVDNVGGNSTFKGIATAATVPGTPDGNEFYLAAEIGTYSNFNGYVISAIGLHILDNSTGAWVGTALLPELFNKELANDKNITLFERYDVAESQFTDFNTSAYSTKRVEVYSAIKNMKLINFDATKEHRIGFIWVNYLDGGRYRFIIQEWTGAAWSNVYDFDSYAGNTLTLINNTWVIDEWIDGLKVYAIIDLKDLPDIINGTIETSTTTASYVISKKVKEIDEQVKSINTQTLSTKNEILFPCFTRYTDDLSTLTAEYYTYGLERKVFYQAVKKLKLTGFNKDNPHKIEHLWRGKSDDTSNFRFIISQYADSAWSRVFDSGNLLYSVLGVEENKIFNWDQTVNGKRVQMEVDFTNLPIGSQGALNTDEPDLVISNDCFFDPETTLNFAGAKNYFNSRRKPTFAFVWDDLLDSDGLVYSIFQEYGFTPTFALKTENLNDDNAAVYQDFYSKGCSILAHSVSHPVMSDPGTITAAEVEAEMADSKKAIEQYGIKVSGWATPSSVLDSSFFDLMVKYFGYGFTALNAGLFDNTVDPLKMNRYGLESNIDDDTHSWSVVEQRIDDAITNTELVVFYGHQIPSWYDDIYGEPLINETDLRNLLSYLRAKVDAGLCQVLSCDEAIYQYYKTYITY